MRGCCCVVSWLVRVLLVCWCIGLAAPTAVLLGVGSIFVWGLVARSASGRAPIPLVLTAIEFVAGVCIGRSI